MGGKKTPPTNFQVAGSVEFVVSKRGGRNKQDIPDIPTIYTLPETNIFAPENRPSQKETIVFQPSIFRCELLVSGRVMA